MATQMLSRPARSAWWLTLLLTLFVIINYVDRGAIGIAAPKLRQDLGLDHKQFGLAVSAFAWIYAPAQFFIGWLSTRVCVYRLIATGLALWALATFATGFVTGLAALVACRVLLGIGEGVAFPCASKIIAAHVPADRRGLANGVMSTALGIGPALGIFAGGLILASHGWRPIFWIFGALTLLWLAPWLMASKPHWTTRERVKAEVPLSAVTRYWAPWAQGIAHFCTTYGFFFLLAWLPLYLIESRGFTILEMASITTSFYLLQAASGLFWGWLSDIMVKQGHDEGKVRRLLMVVFMLSTAASTLAIGLAPDRATLIAALMIFGIFGGIGAFNAYAIAQLCAGKAAGAWVGVLNGVGNISGIVGPILTGMIIEAAGGNYLGAFYLATAIALFGALWWIFAVPRIEPVPALVSD